MIKIEEWNQWSIPWASAATNQFDVSTKSQLIRYKLNILRECGEEGFDVSSEGPVLDAFLFNALNVQLEHGPAPANCFFRMQFIQ